MQYGVDVSTYKRTNKKNSKPKEKNIIRDIIKYSFILLISLLISRVKFINNTAPFGIAFYMVILINFDIRENFYSALGMILGYFTIIRELNFMPAYILIIGALYTLEYFNYKITRKMKFMLSIGTVISVLSINYLLIIGLDIMIVVYVTLNILCILPIFYILSKGVDCYKNYNQKLLFTNEDIISMGVLLSLIIAGTRDISIVNIFFMNILSLLLTMMLAYVSGPALGATVGVSLGVICGMSGSNMMIYVAVYSIVGLVIGLIKDSNKWVCGFAGLVVYFILIIYNQEQTVFIGIEALLALLVFYITPKKIYDKISNKININNKQEYNEPDYMNKAKEIYKERFQGLSSLLYNISNVLSDYIDNEKLEMKYKSSGLVQNLADRVCSGCNLNNVCWKREMHYTYSAFGELIQNCENKSRAIPERLVHKCVSKDKLLKNAEELVNKFVINEMKKNSLSEGRKIISEQINNMAVSMDDIIKNVDSNIFINIEKENMLKNVFYNKSIEYKEITCLESENGKIQVKLKLKACGGRNNCVKNIVPILNKALNKNLCVSNEGCCINEVDKCCTILFEEMPKYHSSTYVVQKCKEGEQENGDNARYFKMNNGEYVSILSDGMGSGPSAYRESYSIASLLEKFYKSGFDKIASLNAINSVMAMKYREYEKFSTVDLSGIDLYSGDIEFVKVGAVESFIKRRNNSVEIVQASSLPIGVLDKIDCDVYKNNVGDGDVIVMISDGILDYNDDKVGSAKWIKEYLKRDKNNNPKDIAIGLLNEAMKLNEFKIKDDMTVMVTKVYNIH